MKCIVAGSRTITDYAIVVAAIKASGFEITEAVSGGAWEVDLLGEHWAYKNGVNKKTFLPDYKMHGRYLAPKLRNQQMADYADALIAVWNGRSGGTRDMIDRATKAGLQVFIYPAK